MNRKPNWPLAWSRARQLTRWGLASLEAAMRVEGVVASSLEPAYWRKLDRLNRIVVKLNRARARAAART